MSDIEGKVAREAMSQCGQRASFKTFTDVRRASADEHQYDVRGRRWMDCIGRVALRPSDREIASQIRDWEAASGLTADDSG
jgi:hypothetical protein